MASITLVPITRAFLAKFYDDYPYSPLCPGIPALSASLRDHYVRMQEALNTSEEDVVAKLEFSPPHKIDENLWKNREQIEEILYLLDQENWPLVLKQDQSLSVEAVKATIADMTTELSSLLQDIQEYQTRSTDKVADMVMTYMPQDFRGALLRQQKERSEKRRQAEVDLLVSNGGSIREKYALLWSQQMERRRQLALLGSATGVYKALVKYLVGVPQVLLDFVRQINDHYGPMEEQRVRYGPPLHQLTILSTSIRIFLVLWWLSFDKQSLCTDTFISILEKSVRDYAAEFKHFLNFLGEVFNKSPFLISAEEARRAEGIEEEDDFKETIILAGKTHEVTLSVDCGGSLVAWDFSLTSGKDIGFFVEYTDGSGAKMPMLPYQRCESNQGNFYSPQVGFYKLVWDNTYSTFYRKIVRYKVDAIPPVIDTTEATCIESMNMSEA